MKQSPFVPILTRLILSGVLLLCCLAIPAAQSAQPARPAAGEKTWPLTRPEASNFAETSLYAEVVSFIQAMADRSPQIHLATFGYSY